MWHWGMWLVMGQLLERITKITKSNLYDSWMSMWNSERVVGPSSCEMWKYWVQHLPRTAVFLLLFPISFWPTDKITSTLLTSKLEATLVLQFCVHASHYLAWLAIFAFTTIALDFRDNIFLHYQLLMSLLALSFCSFSLLFLRCQELFSTGISPVWWDRLLSLLHTE